MKSFLFFICLIVPTILLACQKMDETGPRPHGLNFSELPTSWDEGIPLGNGILGALIWQKEGKLRFSLDRTDLWDERPVKNLSLPEFSYQWVQDQVKNDNYKAVQAIFDVPYDQMPAPTKIPGAALEFDTLGLGKVSAVSLDAIKAICTVKWENGTVLETFVQGDGQMGWFRFSNVPNNFLPTIIPPEYQKESISNEDNAVTGQDLQRLGYEQGKVTSMGGKQVYIQNGWDNFKYGVAVKSQNTDGDLVGAWTITSSLAKKAGPVAGIVVDDAFKNQTYEGALSHHLNWWKKYWNKSFLSLPDSILEKQYYLEMYKFGSVARADAPPISLQAVWTADNGKLPPWKGDFHHDLNTQLSYWPAYTGNHLDLEKGFLNWLWENQANFKAYTKTYFNTSGMNVPGVTTLSGQPMGGWIQYSFGPTVAAWLSHHFYLHWVYSKDKVFLKERAYPWIKEVAIYLDEISETDQEGKRKLPISSSPEINNNDRSAWFSRTTNFDLALIRWTYEKAAALALELGRPEEAELWGNILKEWPDLALNEDNGGLAVAPGYPLPASHRHFSHIMAWHPLGLIDWSASEKEREIVKATLEELERTGTDWWTGYSFSWLGNLYARAFMGDKAVETLTIFAENFCLPNSFHVNGEQHDRGFSNFKYRPFTLEGNFAFASAVQEMLIQSHTGTVRLFPAIPDSWKEVSFHQFRTRGAFLVSAAKKGGEVERVEIYSEKGGLFRLKNPFGERGFEGSDAWEIKEEGMLLANMKMGEKLILEAQ